MASAGYEHHVVFLFHMISIYHFTLFEYNQKIFFRPSFKRYIKRIITCCTNTVYSIYIYIYTIAIHRKIIRARVILLQIVECMYNFTYVLFPLNRMRIVIRVFRLRFRGFWRTECAYVKYYVVRITKNVYIKKKKYSIYSFIICKRCGCNYAFKVCSTSL